MVWKILQRFSKKKGRAPRALLPFEGERRDKLLTLVSGKDFSLFLEFLELTISEKIDMVSSIDLLEEENQKIAIRLQGQIRGMQTVVDICDSLIDSARGFGYKDDDEPDETD